MMAYLDGRRLRDARGSRDHDIATRDVLLCSFDPLLHARVIQTASAPVLISQLHQISNPVTVQSECM